MKKNVNLGSSVRIIEIVRGGSRIPIQRAKEPSANLCKKLLFELEIRIQEGRQKSRLGDETWIR